MKRVIAFAVGVLVSHASSAQDAPSAVPEKAALCVACHGVAGHSTQGQYPSLAGQTARYLTLELRDFQAGRRKDPVMSPMAAGLSRDEMAQLAAYFAAQKLVTSGFRSDPAKAQLGKAKADETLCFMCHLGGFAGQNEVPRLAGQQYDYVVKQLTAFKTRTRTNDAGTMTSVAGTLSDDDIANLANYIAGL